ncbi:MAG: glucosamine-6-phosphate deaminase [Acidobacteriaceae bacterium]|nr:glucosamine-6-phosphate deaminase [Acidobacteriaceae bacterium]MBV9780324.1 glucosamine-6-phosphate deaminase [Acidobacteriaceae bacterium]
MSNSAQSTEFVSGKARVHVFESPAALGNAAAEKAAALIKSGIERRGRARVIVATGNSQLALIEELVKKDVNWSAVEIFHMDEYAGMKAGHAASFRRWIKTRVEDKVHPAKANYLAGDATDLDAEIERYSRLLNKAPIDLAFVGFGENGHIAFNDPHVADFNDPATVKRVTLDERCRRQQAGEGHFKDIESVPAEALTVTCSGLFRAEAWVCAVPDRRKAEAVRGALEGPISETCPASLVQNHPDANVYLDRESASLLSTSRNAASLAADSR